MVALTVIVCVVVLVIGVLASCCWRSYRETGSLIPPSTHGYAQARLSDDSLVPRDGAGTWRIPAGCKVVGFVFPASSRQFSPTVRVHLNICGWLWVCRDGAPSCQEIKLLASIAVAAPVLVTFTSKGMSISGGFLVPHDSVAPATVPFQKLSPRAG